MPNSGDIKLYCLITSLRLTKRNSVLHGLAKWMVLAQLLLMADCSVAQFQLASQFSDNMVLQRDKPVMVWGKAVPGAIVTVKLGNCVNVNTARSDSNWKVVFPSFKASVTPLQLEVYSGMDSIRIGNILIGDVWICIGQSNMEWPMKKEKYFHEINSDISAKLLRFNNPVYAGKNIFGSDFSDSVIQRLTAEKFYTGKWDTCSYASISNMSAVAYYFGATLLEKTGIPIGLVNLSIGGAPLETFISKETMGANEQFAAKVNSDWLTNPALPVWVRERGLQNVGNKQAIPADKMGPNHAFKPGFAFESGISPLLSFPITGVICYQGESNAQELDRVAEYGALSILLVEDYRVKWQQPDLPFYFVQLSSIDSLHYKSQLWPAFRNEQRKMLSLIPNVGMAVCSDIGAMNDVHPVNKKLVGQRLARWAIRFSYHQQILASGPLPVNARYKNRNIIIRFRYAGKGLASKENTELNGFTVDGINSAKAKIKGSKKVIIFTERTPFVYYGWSPYSNGNLINSELLPASTFKIEVK